MRIRELITCSNDSKMNYIFLPTYSRGKYEDRLREDSNTEKVNQVVHLFAGSPRLKCYKLTIPLCMGLGYDHTSATPAQQRDNQTIQSLIQFIGNDAECSPFLRRVICIESYFPPCFQRDLQGYYSLCRSDCENMSYICHDKISKLLVGFRNWRATHCPNFGTREGPKGLCKVTSWPQEFLWQLVPAGGEPSQRSRTPHLSTGKLAAAISTPVVVLIALLIGVGVWLRNRHPSAGYYLHDGRTPEYYRANVAQMSYQSLKQILASWQSVFCRPGR